jgi:hypothetical protein
MEYTNTFVKEFVQDTFELNIDDYESFDDLDKKKIKYINDTYIENDKLYQAYLKSKKGTFHIFNKIYNFVNMKQSDPIVFYTILKSMFTVSIFFVISFIITIFTIPILFYVLIDFSNPYTYKIYACIVITFLIYFFGIRGRGL